MNPKSFENLRLRGGFVVLGIDWVIGPLVDAAGRNAVGNTRIIGREILVTLTSGLDEKEKSVSLYHEVLEAMSVACEKPPDSVTEFNEGDFEKAGYEAHKQFGPASPDNLNRMLQFYGFEEE